MILIYFDFYLFLYLQISERMCFAIHYTLQQQFSCYFETTLSLLIKCQNGKKCDRKVFLTVNDDEFSINVHNKKVLHNAQCYASATCITAKEKRDRYMVKNLKVNKIRIKAQQCVNNLNKRFIDIKLYKHHQNTSLCSTQFCTRIFNVTRRQA